MCVNDTEISIAKKQPLDFVFDKILLLCSLQTDTNKGKKAALKFIDIEGTIVKTLNYFLLCFVVQARFCIHF